MSFEKALKFVLEREGGFVDNPYDKGGTTNKGITQVVYDAFRDKNGKPKQSVKAIEDWEVSFIYKIQYWMPSNCDRFSDNLALVVFDSSVNHGVRKACQFLQHVIGATEDGVWGPKSQATLEQCLETNGEPYVTDKYISTRSDFYDRIVKNNPSQNVFLKGWKNRLDALKKEIA